MTTKQLINDVSDISNIVAEMHTDIHTYMNDIGGKIDRIDIECSCVADREIVRLKDFIEKETVDISNDIDNVKDNIDNLKDNTESWIEDIRSDISDLKLDIETIVQEQDKLKDDIKDIREKLGEILTLLYENRN
jgi:regulator of replication initiation timing